MERADLHRIVTHSVFSSSRRTATCHLLITGREPSRAKIACITDHGLHLQRRVLCVGCECNIDQASYVIQDEVLVGSVLDLSYQTTDAEAVKVLCYAHRDAGVLIRRLIELYKPED